MCIQAIGISREAGGFHRQTGRGSVVVHNFSQKVLPMRGRNARHSKDDFEYGKIAMPVLSRPNPIRASEL